MTRRVERRTGNMSTGPCVSAMGLGGWTLGSIPRFPVDTETCG